MIGQTSIGRVVEVHGSRVNIELDPGQRSPVRATLDGAETQIRINALVTFELGAGDAVLGMITDLYAREVFEPGDSELTLELVRPRRIASAQLLGTLRTSTAGTLTFDPGVNVLPTLETPAVPARADTLKAVIEDAPARNRPNEHDGAAFDYGLHMGHSTAAPDRRLEASYNDLFSRPFAVVGNTGSGKSCTIAHVLQEAIRVARGTTAQNSERPHFFVIDINGEYASAFSKAGPDGGKQPNCIYVDGQPFGVPVWLMNAHEVCQWLSAAEQVQEPALKQFWALAKSTGGDADATRAVWIGAAIQKLDDTRPLLDKSGPYKRNKVRIAIESVVERVKRAIAADTDTELSERCDALIVTLESAEIKIAHGTVNEHDLDPAGEADLIAALAEFRDLLRARAGESQDALTESADKPLPIALSILSDPQRLYEAAQIEGAGDQFGANLRGLQLRLANRLADKRWACMKNYEAEDTRFTSASDWFRALGIGRDTGSRVSVIDCSMLSHEVLPYVCGVLGRTLLELREYVVAERRFYEPWVVVLEEAHNYIAPSRMTESKGVSISRQTFERIAKEGRKFGMSLIVASQRPSDISPTVLSQCANFVTHRLQNPDDIDHFRKIVPSQSRRLLEQITILVAGEGIALGSAFNIPMRVQVQRPSPEPTSESSSPFLAWKHGSERFDLDAALAAWELRP